MPEIKSVPKQSGIYQILNLINQKFYIGSATYIKSRIGFHKYQLRNNKHNNSYLQRAWNKYGEATFEFRILELVEDKSKLIEREQFYLDQLRPFDREIGYNLRTIANLNLGYKFSEEYKLKIKLSNIGKKRSKETCIKIGLAKKGLKQSEEVKAKKSAKMKGNQFRKGVKLSDEHKRKISESMKRKNFYPIIEGAFPCQR